MATVTTYSKTAAQARLLSPSDIEHLGIKPYVVDFDSEVTTLNTTDIYDLLPADVYIVGGYFEVTEAETTNTTATLAAGDDSTSDPDDVIVDVALNALSKTVFPAMTVTTNPFAFKIGTAAPTNARFRFVFYII